MTGSWLTVRWVVASTGGLGVGLLLLLWMIEGVEFVSEKRGQGILLACALAFFLSLEGQSQVWLALAELIYASLLIVLLKNLTQKAKILLKADS